MDSDQKDAVKNRLLDIFKDAFDHDGYSDFHVEIKILKKQQKEVIIHYGKQYRFVLDYKKPVTSKNDHSLPPAAVASFDS